MKHNFRPAYTIVGQRQLPVYDAVFMEMTESQCDFSEIETGGNEMKRYTRKNFPLFCTLFTQTYGLYNRERGGGGGGTHTHTP